MSSAPRGRTGRAWLLVALLGFIPLLSGPAGGAQGTVGGITPEPQGEFDIAGGQRFSTLEAGVNARSVKVPNGRVLTGVEVRLDGLTGSASRVRVPGGTLTGPGPQAPVTIARGFLAANRPVFQLSGEDITALQPVRAYETPGLGMRHVTLQPVHGGIPVLRSEVKFDLKATGELLTVAGAAVPNLAGTVNTVTPRLSARQGLRAAAQAAGVAGPAMNLTVPAVEGTVAGTRRKTVFAANALYERGPVVQLSYVPVQRGVTRLAWETTLWRRDTSDVFNVAVDAVTGALLLKNNYTAHASGPIYDRESPQDTSPYLGVTPPFLNRTVKTFDGAEFFNNGDLHRDWWAGNAQTVTDGNNVTAGSLRDVHAARQLATAATGDFTFPLDLAQQPVTYRQAAITNLFYWVNRCHDVWYGFGFNEAAGNFQKNNFGLGGAGGDPVLANAQHGADESPASRNNANFSTPPDGQSGTMRMFEWSYTSPLRDSDLSADVIVHEFGHGVTNRLIGNASGLNGFQGSSMGEGLSDFQGLMVLAQSDDDLTKPYPLAGWLLNNYVAGLRSQPYSAGRVEFTRTYGDIGEHSGTYGPEVHLAGEIICNAMFQMYGRFVSRLGFTEGRNRAMQLFIDASKLCPGNPTYLDYRDALLTADQLRYASNNTADIWTVFAAQGMGAYAYSSGVDDLRPTEDFSLPGTGTLPGRPSNFGASLSGTQVTCTWSDNANNETGFKLERAVNQGAFQELAQPNIPANSTSVSFALNGFNPGDVISLRVKAVNARGQSPASDPDTVTLAGGTLPAAPTDFNAVLAGRTGVDLTWRDNSNNETRFLIEYAFNGQALQPLNDVFIAPNSISASLSLTGFVPGRTLTLRVRAVNAAGQSPPSNEVTLIALGGSFYPAPPSNFSAALQGGNTALCAWKDNTNNETGFQLERSVNGGPFAELEQPSINANATSVSVPLSGVNPGDVLAFRVKSLKDSLESAPSNAATVLLPNAAGPAAPTNFTATLSSATLVKCTWTDNSRDEQGFRLERSVNGGAFTELSAPVIKANKKAANLTLTGVAAGDQITLRVKAYNANGGSLPSNTASVTVPLSAPSSLKAKLKPGTEGRTAVTLTYKDLSTGETGFRIEVAGPTGGFQEVKTVDANVVSTDITGLTPNTKYQFRVRAFKAALNSGYSNTAKAKTKK